MESLARMVLIILSVVVFAGLIALGLSFTKSSNATVRKIRRVLIGLLGSIGFLVSLQLFLSLSNIGPKLIGIFGMTTSIFALRKEYWLSRKS
ncbi:unannotated protein [freshwater metagenome]|uniref:Unannotated protein n=1 Tax=freshwater metagenome TaxID=449393 RepID=A0A6J7XTB1_9ZZZZ|nr:hypothetical protein [Actinomycetota bacterium]